MSHSQHLRRVSREYVIDLYLRPPVTKYRLMDYMHIERIVTSANRCAWQLLYLFVLHAAGGVCPGAPRWAGASPTRLHPQASACRLAVGSMLTSLITIAALHTHQAHCDQRQKVHLLRDIPGLAEASALLSRPPTAVPLL